MEKSVSILELVSPGLTTPVSATRNAKANIATLTDGLLFIFLLFFNTPCWHWWDSQVSWLFNYVSFFKVAFRISCLSRS